MSLVDLTVSGYLRDLASVSPAPGGGSASALSGAQGAGLLSMVALFTVKSKKLEERHQIAQSIADQTAALAEKLTAQIDLDADSFNLVASAFQLPKDTPEEKAARSAAIQQGTLEAAKVPMTTMSLSVEALRLGETLAQGFNTNAASDLGVAALHLVTAVEGAWLNVAINCGSLKDKEAAAALSAQGETLVQEAHTLAQAITKAAQAAIFG